MLTPSSPGSGLTVGQLDVTKVSHVLGVEPCVHLHDALRENVRLAGLADVYEVSGLGAEQLQLEPESVDTVVCCKVLCGVPEPEKVLAQLYRVLKPGGQFLVFEHVANRRSWVAGAWQGKCGA